MSVLALPASVAFPGTLSLQNGRSALAAPGLHLPIVPPLVLHPKQEESPFAIAEESLQCECH